MVAVTIASYVEATAMPCMDMLAISANFPRDQPPPQPRRQRAALLLNFASNEQPSAEDIKSVPSSVGVDAEGDRLEKLISELSGNNAQEGRIC
jgi:hypothetical protein